MKIKRFEDCLAWKKAGVLTIEIRKKFKSCKDYNFKDQIERAVLSVMNNIAEGFERRTNKELRNFLYIAKGSCGEVRSMLYVALRLGYIDNNTLKDFKEKAEEISKILAGFIKSIN